MCIRTPTIVRDAALAVAAALWVAVPTQVRAESLASLAHPDVTSGIEVEDRAMDPAEALLGPPYRDPVVKHLAPVAGMLGANLTLWSFDRYVLDADYARIGADTVASNFREGFGWDQDGFAVNQFGHPYQGGLYHNAARAAGHGFWASIPYTVLGSLQWELFMESERPAINDLVTTVAGGVIVGEVLHRTANLLRDGSSHGSGRLFRELGAAILDPAGGIHRLVWGAGRAPGHTGPRPPFTASLSAGLDQIELTDEVGSRVRNLHFEAQLSYGELPRKGESLSPFDRFTASVGFDVGENTAATILDLDGLLAGIPLACGKGRCVLGVAQSFDYSDGPLFQVGTIGVGPAFHADLVPTPGLKLGLVMELQGVPLGGFGSPYAEAKGTPYHLGSGHKIRADVTVALGSWQLAFENRRYLVSVLRGASGRELAGHSSLALHIPLHAPFGLELGTAFYDRTSIIEGLDMEERTIFVGQTRLVASW